ncbi:MAG: hypothetical protein QOI36_5131 [Pseudonocardiales bacterium]|nr:hypothetical protein [Pseudonocardiales bacterium]
MRTRWWPAAQILVLAAQQSRQRLQPEKAAVQASRKALQFTGGAEAGRTVFNALWRALDRDGQDYRREEADSQPARRLAKDSRRCAGLVVPGLAWNFRCWPMPQNS